jgi:hypothetical protein
MDNYSKKSHPTTPVPGFLTQRVNAHINFSVLIDYSYPLKWLIFNTGIGL